MSVFSYRAPTEAEKAHLAALQEVWLATEAAINEHVPAGRERALAITKLQECRMWANTGVVLAVSPDLPRRADPQPTTHP